MIGHPVAHSRSPAMHTAAYRALGLDWEYTAVDVPPSGLAAFIAGLEADGYAGVNVTIPHKQAVLPLCGELSAEARLAGSVNTVLVREGAPARRDDRRRGPPVGARRRRARRRARAGRGRRGPGGGDGLAGGGVDGGGQRPPPRGRGPSSAPASCPGPRPSRRPLVVNATPIGQHEYPVPGTQYSFPPELIEPGMIVVDLAYRGDGSPTPLIAAAVERGARAVDGLEVLVGQGILAFELFTGVAAPVDVMRAAARGQTAPGR